MLKNSCKWYQKYISGIFPIIESSKSVKFKEMCNKIFTTQSKSIEK